MKVMEFVRLAWRYRVDPFYIKYLAGRRVLDIGSGRGEFLDKDPLHFVGVELDPELANHCRSNGLEVYCMNALALVFPDESFDAVHASQLIEHFTPSDAALFLREASRVLRP